MFSIWNSNFNSSVICIITPAELFIVLFKLSHRHTIEAATQLFGFRVWYLVFHISSQCYDYALVANKIIAVIKRIGFITWSTEENAVFMTFGIPNQAEIKWIALTPVSNSWSIDWNQIEGNTLKTETWKHLNFSNANLRHGCIDS